jgi:hypothetical protein
MIAAGNVDPVLGYDFMMCLKCKRVWTKLQIARGLNERQGKICRCGSLMYRPTNAPSWWIFRPAVLWFAILRWMRRA